MKNSITPRAKPQIHKSNTRSLHLKKPGESLKITVQLISPKHQKSKTMPMYSTPCTTHASSSCSDDPFQPNLKSSSLARKTPLRPDDFIEPVPDLSIPSLETYNQFKKPSQAVPGLAATRTQKAGETAEKPLKRLKKFKMISSKGKSKNFLTARTRGQIVKIIENNQRIILIKPKQTA